MTSNDRRLRSPELRSALYQAADGRCQGCGEPLGESWHADHAVPWSVSKRTNVFEMRALCAPCNLRKGNKTMRRLPVFDFNKGKFRQGQNDAFDETVLRIQQRGERHTAIVLPTRYGKSDYMRMTGLHLLHQGAVSGVLVMTPNRVLRNQMVDEQKLRQSFSLYEAKLERTTARGERRKGISPYNMVDSPKIQMMVDSEIVAATTSMVSHHMQIFQHWIDHLRKSYGVPPVIFVDEAHTASNRTAWGKTIADLADTGAYIVLCTATPYRTDGQPIPGFEVESISVEDLQDRQRRGAHIYQRQGQRVVYELVAHHVTTFEQAWQESVLCQVSRESFDVDLREHGMDGYEHHMLSGLESELSSRRASYQAVRDPAVIREGVRRLVRNLRYRRKDAPETAGIVFVGSDDGSDLDDEQDELGGQLANQYANMVQQILREEGPELTSVIATSKVDGDPTKSIEAFAKGPRGGDVLVVKMMASAGLDVARLKVALDLSTVRTAVSFVQRVMRICTRWERDEGEPVLRATYITPDESRGRELYNDLIHDLGGSTSEMIRWDEQSGEIIMEPYAPMVPTPLTTWEVTGTEEGEYLTDSDGTTAPGSTLPYVDAIYEEESALTRVIGKAKLGQAILKTAEKYAKDYFGVAGPAAQSENGPVAPPTPETEETTDGEFIDNVQGRMETLRKSMVKEVKARAARQLRQDNGGTFPKELLGPAIQECWVWLYRKAGIPWRLHVRLGQRLKALDEDQLRKMWHILREEA